MSGARRAGMPGVALVVALVWLSGCIDACQGCGRKARPGDREPHYIVVQTPEGGFWVTERPIIPEHLRANCEVCPYWCEQADLRPLPVPVLIRKYREHAAIYASKERRPYPAGWATLEQLACIAGGGGPAMKERFAALLEDPDPAIRFPAALHALQHDIDRPAALRTLRTMMGCASTDEFMDSAQDGPDGHDYAGHAFITLIEYQLGNELSLP